MFAENAMLKCLKIDDLFFVLCAASWASDLIWAYLISGFHRNSASQSSSSANSEQSTGQGNSMPQQQPQANILRATATVHPFSVDNMGIIVSLFTNLSCIEFCKWC